MPYYPAAKLLQMSSLKPMNPLSEEIHELIRQQASYSVLVAWLQKRQGCTYQEACKQVNQVLQQYRIDHTA